MKELLSQQTIEEVRLVPLDRVKMNPHQPRKIFDLEALTELGKSIETVGLIHPITVRPIENELYELVSGERRYRACQLMGMQEISILVKTRASENSAQAALIENIQRVDLNPLEIAQALHRLASEFNFSQEKLSQKIGKKRSTVANYMRLLSLSPLIQKAIAEETLSMGHAKAILSLDCPAAQERLYRRIIDNRLSVREAEQIATKKSFPKQFFTNTKPQGNIHIKTLEEKLQNQLGTKVKITGSPSHGQIHIDFYCLDDLHDLLERLEIQEE